MDIHTEPRGVIRGNTSVRSDDGSAEEEARAEAERVLKLLEDGASEYGFSPGLSIVEEALRGLLAASRLSVSDRDTDEVRDAIAHIQGAVEFQDAINPEAIRVVIAAASRREPSEPKCEHGSTLSDLCQTVESYANAEPAEPDLCRCCGRAMAEHPGGVYCVPGPVPSETDEREWEWEYGITFEPSTIDIPVSYSGCETLEGARETAARLAYGSQTWSIWRRHPEVILSPTTEWEVCDVE